MKKNILMMTVLLGISSASVQAQQLQKNKVTPLQYYCTHLITSFLSPIAMIPSMLGTVGAGAIAAEAKEPLIKIIAGLLAAGSAASAGVVFYKIPQWTDNYLLELPTQRTAAQNIISLLARIAIPFPFGSLLSEALIREDQ